jgi:hypothetical protein
VGRAACAEARRAGHELRAPLQLRAHELEQALRRQPLPHLLRRPDPPLRTMPGVEAYDVELLRAQVLAETASPGGPHRTLLELRYLAARYGPPEIAALARPEQLPRAPRRRQD